jgi:hypothetical protein
MKIQEIDDLKEQWLASYNEPEPPAPHNRAVRRDVLHERLDILHRLNELGETNVNGLPIIEALEETNTSIRKIDRCSG